MSKKYEFICFGITFKEWIRLRLIYSNLDKTLNKDSLFQQLKKKEIRGINCDKCWTDELL